MTYGGSGSVIYSAEEGKRSSSRLQAAHLGRNYEMEYLVLAVPPYHKDTHIASSNRYSFIVNKQYDLSLNHEKWRLLLERQFKRRILSLMEEEAHHVTHTYFSVASCALFVLLRFMSYVQYFLRFRLSS